MKWNHAIPAALLLSALLFLSACQTDYTPDAVETAREYALKNLTGITESQRQFIRFTEPEIYENVIFPRYVMPLTDVGHIKSENQRHYPTVPIRDHMHSCIVWSPPDLGAKVVVVGDGERSMWAWRPSRVLVKSYWATGGAYRGALDACAIFARDKLLFLSTAAYNRVRFSEPEIVFTKFDVAASPAEPRPSGKLSEWEDYLAEIEAENKKTGEQVSLVWPSDKAEERIVFVGQTPGKSFAGWRICSARNIAASKLAEFTLSPEEQKARGLNQGGFVAPVRSLPKTEEIDRRKELGKQPGGSVIIHR